MLDAKTERALKAQIKALKQEVRLATAEADSAERIRQEVYDLAAQTPRPPAWLHSKHGTGAPGVPVTFWSDWHWGERVFKNQVGGVNEFSRAIGKRRVKRLTDKIVTLAKDYMVNPDYPGIVVCLGGDMISGNIHEELRETNEGPVQRCLLEVQEQLIMALTAMADEFGKVYVPCVVGNHGRNTLKPRAKNRVFESYEWNLYCQLEFYFRDDKRFTFSIPEGPDAIFRVYDHRFLLTHGDALGVKGGDGLIGALGPIARGAIKIGRSQAQIGRDFDTLLMGHWHSYMPRGDLAPVIVNGSLKGYDEYAHTLLRVPYSRPSQALWFVHPAYGITAQWPVWLEHEKKGQAVSWVSFEQQRRTA